MPVIVGVIDRSTISIKWVPKDWSLRIRWSTTMKWKTLKNSAAESVDTNGYWRKQYLYGKQCQGRIKSAWPVTRTWIVVLTVSNVRRKVGNFWTSLGSSSISHNALYISHKINFKIWIWMAFAPFFSITSVNTSQGSPNTTIWRNETWWETGGDLQWLARADRTPSAAACYETWSSATPLIHRFSVERAHYIRNQPPRWQFWVLYPRLSWCLWKRKAWNMTVRTKTACQRKEREETTPLRCGDRNSS